MSKRQLGFVDPLGLIGVAILLVSLVVSTNVVINHGSFDIRSWAKPIEEYNDPKYISNEEASKQLQEVVRNDQKEAAKENSSNKSNDKEEKKDYCSNTVKAECAKNKLICSPTSKGGTCVSQTKDVTIYTTPPTPTPTPVAPVITSCTSSMMRRCHASGYDCEVVNNTETCVGRKTVVSTPTPTPIPPVNRDYLSAFCMPGDTKCSGNTVQSCNNDQTAWETFTNCIYGCENGKCKDKPIDTPAPNIANYQPSNLVTNPQPADINAISQNMLGNVVVGGVQNIVGGINDIGTDTNMIIKSYQNNSNTALQNYLLRNYLAADTVTNVITLGGASLEDTRKAAMIWAQTNATANAAGAPIYDPARVVSAVNAGATGVGLVSSVASVLPGKLGINPQNMAGKPISNIYESLNPKPISINNPRSLSGINYPDFDLQQYDSVDGNYTIEVNNQPSRFVTYDELNQSGLRYNNGVLESNLDNYLKLTGQQPLSKNMVSVSLNDPSLSAVVGRIEKQIKAWDMDPSNPADVSNAMEVIKSTQPIHYGDPYQMLIDRRQKVISLGDTFTVESPTAVCYEMSLVCQAITAKNGTITKIINAWPANKVTNEVGETVYKSAGTGHSMVGFVQNNMDMITDPATGITFPAEAISNYLTTLNPQVYFKRDILIKTQQFFLPK